MSERRRKEELRQSEIAAAYQKLQFLQNGADGEHSREWLETASYLIDSFRETPALFPSDGVRLFYPLYRFHHRVCLNEICARRKPNTKASLVGK